MKDSVASNFQSFLDVEDFLNSIPMFSQRGTKAANFNLDRMKEFCRALGDPQINFKSIHVAGTNGKGTVCRMLASVYQTAGFKTGMYTSPHLVNFRERFMINGNMIDECDLIDFFNLHAKHIRGQAYTYFEITTAIAFWYFSKNKVDIAIIETGLGGRLDATNVIFPEISVITSIGMDHTDLLGTTLESIAGEKAGIIKPQIPVVVGNLLPEAKNVIKKIADKHESKLTKAEKYQPRYLNGSIVLMDGDTEIRLKKTFLKKIDAVNVAVSYDITRIMSDRLFIAPEKFISGIEQMAQNYQRRGTFEKLAQNKEWYFDGAHNTEAIEQLISHLEEIAPPNCWTAVLSFMKDKLNPEIASLWSRFPNIKLAGMKFERAATLAEMKQLFPHATELILNEKNRKNDFETELVIFTGSFYFYNEVCKWMGTILAIEDNLSALKE